jgi:type I restriction enzyme R subunit
MNDYTSRDKKQFGDPDIQKTAKVKFQEKLEICRDLLYGFDYSGFFDGTDPERARIIKGGLNFLLAPDKADKQKDYIKESQLLHNALTLCRSLISPREKQEVALIDAIRVLLLRFTQSHGTVSKQEINERISTLIEQSIQSTGVINLFETKREFSLFDEGFIQELRKMKEKNLAVQLLEKLVKERIRQFERTNIVQSQKFSELMNQALSNYLKGMLTNEEVIEELLKMAAEIKRTEEEGNELGLNVEEKAFYDALTSPEGIRQAYSNDDFIALTKELTEQLRKNRTIDWNKKESARAKMRVLVKRLLKKYKYPPEGQEQALQTVMAQCNKWADEEDNFIDTTVSHRPAKPAKEIRLKPANSMLDDVEKDDDVRRLVHNMMELYEGTTIMNIVIECQREFQEKYFSMGGNDWRHLIRDYVRMVTDRPELQETEVFRFSIAG